MTLDSTATFAVRVQCTTHVHYAPPFAGGRFYKKARVSSPQLSADLIHLDTNHIGNILFERSQLV
jgi:hypothetical protein